MHEKGARRSHYETVRAATGPLKTKMDTIMEQASELSNRPDHPIEWESMYSLHNATGSPSSCTDIATHIRDGVHEHRIHYLQG